MELDHGSINSEIMGGGEAKDLIKAHVKYDQKVFLTLMKSGVIYCQFLASAFSAMGTKSKELILIAAKNKSRRPFGKLHLKICSCESTTRQELKLCANVWPQGYSFQ